MLNNSKCTYKVSLINLVNLSITKNFFYKENRLLLHTTIAFLKSMITEATSANYKRKHPLYLKIMC